MASGLPPDIVEQIMGAEKIPVKNLETKKTIQEETLKIVADLETKIMDITKNLGELTGTRGFSDTKLISGDPNLIEGSVDPDTAVTGEYALEVSELAQKPGALSNGFPDKNETQIGVGYIRFQTPEGEKEVYIGSGGASTLEGAVKQINAANVGVRAMVFEDHKDHENPYRLMVTGLATGTGEQIEFPSVYMLDGDQDFFFDQSRKGSNAKVKVDGFEIELAENVVKDLIPGVTLDLKQAAPGREVRITVKEDMEVISGKIKTFVDSYNAALGWIQGQNKLQKGQSGRESLGPLGGDSMLRNIENRLRRIIQSPQYGVESPITRVMELGIEFNRNGTLNFSQEKFNKTLATNPKGVAAFLRGDGFNTGFVPTLKREIGMMTNGQFGAIAQRKKGLQDKIETMNRQIDNKERQLEKKEEHLRRKFSDLETKMSKLQQQGASLSGGMAMPKG
ncbi:MAG: flagellar filament capping protein FliD [Bdellovibrionaceae bacterium]|nr:flagellar filament capping protein FliD [Pseudobdellovibrionaceae bacterium]